MYRSMAYSSWDEMVFGRSIYPVRCGFDLEIGAGMVHPELKYHPRPGTEKDFDTIYHEYERMTRDILDRCIQIGLPSVVLELEHVFQLTDNPKLGKEIAHMTKWLLKEYYDKFGLKSALRVTVADIRKFEKGYRKTEEYDKIMESFRLSAETGADILSIESTGGKEVFNYAITRQDLIGCLFAVGILGSLDMEYLWKDIVNIAKEYNVIPGGDTDCAHSNSAMFLAGGFTSNELSHVFSALIRPIGGARSLVAFDVGAKGPDKDCGYEGPIIKAITGCPISMEGKGCACAHSDLMGNVSAAVCDLWSNEAVQYGEMFGGSTPAVFTEILGYDVAQMNSAIRLGTEKILRDIFIESDELRDPQAYVISPRIAYSIGSSIVGGKDYYERSLFALSRAYEELEGAVKENRLSLSKNERETLQECGKIIEQLPESGDRFISECIKRYKDTVPGFRLDSYGLEG